MGSNLEFAGKVALITGGNSGIGAAAARRVAELGAQVVVTGRRQSEGRLLVSDIKRNSGSAAFIQADLSQPEQVKRIVPFTLKTFGRLDYAFNNAGISGENRLLTDQTERAFDRIFAVNVKAMFLLLQDEVKQMMAQGNGGSIVNTASVGGLLAFPTAGPYVASKHAVLGLTNAAAIECGRYGIRVNAVSPGAVRTEMLLDVFGTQEALDEMSALHPIGRIGRPEEIADAVAWLFSDRSPTTESAGERRMDPRWPPPSKPDATIRSIPTFLALELLLALLRADCPNRSLVTFIQYLGG